MPQLSSFTLNTETFTLDLLQDEDSYAISGGVEHGPMCIQIGNKMLYCEVNNSCPIYS